MNTAKTPRRCRLLTLALAAWCLAACQSAGHSSQPGTTASAGITQGMVIHLPGNAWPNTMAVASDGAVWVTEETVSSIARIDPAGYVRQYRIPGESNDPNGILQGPDGRMWFVGLEVIGRVDLAGHMTGWQDRPGANVGLPYAITIGPDDAVWYTNGTGPNGSISRVSPDQPPSVVANFPSTGITLPLRGITTGPDHAVWFSEDAQGYGPDAIGRVDLNGTYTTWSLPPGTKPQTIVSGSDGALWFTEQTGIGRITVTGHTTFFPVAGKQQTTDIISGPDGALWFTTSTQVGRITTPGYITLWPVPNAQALEAIVAAKAGTFWLADAKANVVQQFVPR